MEQVQNQLQQTSRRFGKSVALQYFLAARILAAEESGGVGGGGDGDTIATLYGTRTANAFLKYGAIRVASHCKYPYPLFAVKEWTSPFSVDGEFDGWMAACEMEDIKRATYEASVEQKIVAVK